MAATGSDGRTISGRILTSAWLGTVFLFYALLGGWLGRAIEGMDRSLLSSAALLSGFSAIHPRLLARTGARTAASRWASLDAMVCPSSRATAGMSGFTIDVTHPGTRRSAPRPPRR